MQAKQTATRALTLPPEPALGDQPQPAPSSRPIPTASLKPLSPQPMLDALKARLGEVADLEAAAAVLSWDQETYMPPAAAEARAQQLATLQTLAHTRFTDDATGQLLDDAEAATPTAMATAIPATAIPATAVWKAVWTTPRPPPPPISCASRGATTTASASCLPTS